MSADARHFPHSPSPAVVVPIEVLRLLQHRHVSLVVGDDLSDVAHGQDAACGERQGAEGVTESNHPPLSPCAAYRPDPPFSAAYLPG